MTKDLGVRARPRMGAGQRAVIVAAAALAAGLPAWVFAGSYLKDREAALQRAREWEISGAPCAELSAAEFEARGLKVRKGTVYEGITFYRQFGHMTCTGLRYGSGWSGALYPVCQFTTPKVLKVSTRSGERYFDIGPGRPATIAVPRGEVRCVLAAHFTMARLQGRE